MHFNRDGGLTEESYLNPDGSEWRAVHDYSDSGKLLTRRGYENSGALVAELRYIYDDEDRLIVEQNVAQDGKVTTPITYAYDLRGAKTKIEKLDSFGDAGVMIGIEETGTCIPAQDELGCRVWAVHSRTDGPPNDHLLRLGTQLV